MTEQEDFLQRLMDELNKGYQEYKQNHPDFARVVEEQLEGKTDAEFEAQFKVQQKRTHCETCGEWLEGFDTCSQCGRIDK